MHEIDTVSGIRVDLARPHKSTIRSDDIFWSLSCLPRYVGHTSPPGYSVAQHSVLVWKAMCATQFGNSPFVQLRALFHDAHEAYMGDISGPMGNLLELRQPLARLKERLDAAIWPALAEEVGCDVGRLTEQVDPAALETIKRFDSWMRLYEQNFLQRNGGAYVADVLERGEAAFVGWLTARLAGEPLVVLTQAQAYHSIMKVYNSIREKIGKKR